MIVTYSETVPARIRAQMAYQGLSQFALATKMGWRQERLARRMSGRVTLKISELEEIAAALDVDLEDLGFPAHAKAGRS